MRKRPIETRNGKRRFIRELCNRIRDEVSAKVPSMPTEWDGHELRIYLAERFADSASVSSLVQRWPMPVFRKGRGNDYQSTCAINNL